MLREFADAAKRWGIKICYYCNPEDDGYQQLVAGADPDTYLERQLGMLTELMEEYGPVHRFWFDGLGIMRPNGTNTTEVYSRAFELVRTASPSTLISPYHGDVCNTIGTLYTRSAPVPNSTDVSSCTPADEAGRYFQPSELHGITMQEGPDGNTDAMPTYWFWHPWACAQNVTGCPWVGHANASRMFDSYVATVGHGAVLNMNIPPDMTGTMNASVVEVMYDAGKAINDTFRFNHAGEVVGVSGHCAAGLASIVPTGPFDYIVTMEDLRYGQRIGNYSIEFRREGSTRWEVLVPPVQRTPAELGTRDRPDGHDPRDSHIGHKRIDMPKGVVTSGSSALKIAEVRFSCIRTVLAADPADPVYIRRLSLHRKIVPWENK